MTPVPLRYLDGSRDCLPVKCALFFSENNEVRRLVVLFTDKEEEKLTAADQPHADWVYQQAKDEQGSMVERFKEAMEKLGYQVFLRDQGPSFLSFNLTSA